MPAVTWSRRAFLALLAGVGAALSPLGAAARPRQPKPTGTYSNTYSNSY
jgi:hypothetical protein